VRMKALAADAHFASGQSKRRCNRVDMRLAIDVLLAQQAIGDAHEFILAEQRDTSSLTSLEDQSGVEDA